MKQEEFVEKWQKRFPNFNFSKTIYKGSKLPVKVICEKGHLFTRVANQMFRGCSVCGRQRSIKKHTNTISEQTTHLGTDLLENEEEEEEA